MERYGKGRLKLLEEGLQAQIAEFKTDFSDKDIHAAAKLGSSVGRIKSSEEYARDRELTLNSLLQVPHAMPHTIESESMQDELSMLSRPAYSPENLPLLLHQFYCDRIEQLVQLRHLHLVRWARFAVGQAKVTEELEALFRGRLELILSEYNDAVNRAKRLSVSCDQYLAGKAPPIHVLCEDDILIYLRWLVYHLHCIKNTACFINNMQWLPLIYHDKFVDCLERKKKSKQIRPPSDGPPKSDQATGANHKWQKASQKSKPPYSYMSKVLKKTATKGQFSMATGPAQKLLGAGDRNTTGTVAAGSGGHMANLVSALLDGGIGMGQSVESWLPCHQTDVGKIQELMRELMNTYSIVGPSTFQNQSDELQLYYQVIRKFHSIFQHQEHSTTLHTYDRQPENGAKRNAAKVTFRKPANWVSFIKIRPTPDPVQIEAFAKIRNTVADIDPLLALSCHCTNLHNVNRVLFALRQHCTAVRHPSPITPLSVPAHKTSHDTLLVWKCIYSGLDSRNPLSSEDENGFDASVDSSENDEGGGENPSNPKGNEFEVAEAMKLIHNDSGRRVSSQANSAPKDAYFSFLLMRHLRIRDLRNKCLRVLNYFRSVERSLTINMEGLSLDSPHEQRPRQSGLTSHRHLFNSPADYVVNQSEFMTFMEIENHDDFYSFDKDNQVKVWDPSGVGVVYDVALDDLKQLEAELQVVGSYYLTKCLVDDQDKKRQINESGKLKSSRFRSQHVSSSPQDIDMDLYSERNVDRFALLLDLWSNEVMFLEAKMKVVNCYLECYAHTYDKLERHRLAGTITTCLHRRPRYDAEASYFTPAYEAEVKCLKSECQLLQDMINYQLMEERTYNQQTCGCGEKFRTSMKSDSRTSFHSASSTKEKSHSDSPIPTAYGLPPPLIAEQLISLSGDRRLLIHSHLLEFSGSLSVLASLPQAIQWTLSELVNRQEVTGSAKVLSLHCQLLELLLHEWEERSDVGSDHTPELQQQLFAGVSAEDPHLLAELSVAHSNQVQAAGGGAATPTEQTRLRIQGYADVLQLVSLRHHLLATCSECEVLTKLYKKQLTSLDNEECHAHLRCVPFDLSLRLPGDKTLDQFVGQAREVGKGDSRLDRYNPAKLHLSVKELDEKHVGCFSFRTKADINKLLSGRGGVGVDNVRVSVECQVAHRNALVAACQQNAVIVKRALSHNSEMSEDVPAIKSHASQVNAGVGGGSSQGLQTPQVSSSTVHMEHEIILAKKLKQKFISLQQEKAPVRDHMLARFTAQASSAGRTPEELVKLKCKLVSDFSHNLSKVFTSISLRSQIMRQYDNILHLLSNFSAARDSHFILGKPLELGLNGGLSSASVSSSSSLRSLQLNPGGVGDPRQHLARPFALLTKDGKKLMNLWYVPHFTEILVMFSDLSIEDTNNALNKVVRLVMSLHTLLQYFCAYVQLGGHTHCNHGEMGGAWGGKEGIGSELLQLQSELARLSDPACPVQVADYLSLRCHVTYLQHDVTVRHNLRRALLTADNLYATKIVDSVSTPALLNISQPTPCSAHTHPHTPHLITAPHLSHLPTPLDINKQSKSSVTTTTADLVPWHSVYAKRDCPFNLATDHSWRVGPFIFASLACLGPVEQSIAQGELLGLSLLLDDVLQSSDLAKNSNSTSALQSGISNTNITQSVVGQHTQAVSGSRTSGISRQGSFEQQQQHSNTSRFGGGGLLRAKQSTALGGSASNTLASLQVLVPPMEGLQMMKEFLVKSSQLEVLKLEWGMRMLRLHSVVTQGHSELLESAYKDKVMSWVRKMVAKQQMRDLARMQAESEITESVSVATFITETSTTDHASSSIAETAQELTETVSEMTLRNMQVCRLLELLEQRMIQDTTKALSQLHHLMLNERERDDSTLPLDLWKTAAMNFKEITGLPRSHVVEEFAAQLEKKLSERGDSITTTKGHLKECLHQLSSGVLAREKECYHLYASYYEALLKSQYNQLYQKNQEIAHYKWLLENHTHQSREENMLFVGEQTQSLVMEVTALRSKVADLHQQLGKKEAEVHNRVQQEYQQLVDNLFSASLAVKNRFEGYRGDLYGDISKSLHEVRQSVAESVTKLKEKLGLQDQVVAMTTSNGKSPGDKAMATDADATVTALKAEGVKDIQQENAELSKMVIRMRAVNKWNRHKAEVVHDDRLLSLHAELDSAHQSYLELKMCTEGEVQSLKHQLQAAQKSLGRIERDYEVMRQTMSQERHKKSTTSRAAARSHESHLSKLDKAQGLKLDQLKQELDEKEKQLRQLGMEFDLTQKLTTAEKARGAKAIKTMKQQVSHERHLKLDAFHEVDKLINQVQDYELQQQLLLKGSAHPLISRGLATASGSRLQAGVGGASGTKAPPTAPARLGLASTSQSTRVSTPTGTRLYQQGRAARSHSSIGSEKIDLNQEILALKLI